MMHDGRVGSIDGVRTWALAPAKGRRHCSCCGKRATHLGLGDGVVLTMGCEWFVRTWCRDPHEAFRLADRKPREEVVLRLEIAVDVEGTRYADAKDAVMDAFAAAYTEKVLGMAAGSKNRAARLAGVDRSAFRRLLRKGSTPEGKR